MNIIRKPFPESQYVQERTEKKQIVMHHTVSGDNVDGIINWWKQTPARVATHYIINRQGQVFQLFDDAYWGYHLGCTQAHFQKLGLPYKNLNKGSIGIEMCSWGPVTQHTDGKFYPIAFSGKVLKPNLKCGEVKNVYEYCTSQKYRGYQYFERYSTAQLNALQELLQHLMQTHNIHANYHSDIWSQCSRAMKGEEGVFSHTSYRPDKSDIHPQVELVNMLKTL